MYYNGSSITNDGNFVWNSAFSELTVFGTMLISGLLTLSSGITNTGGAFTISAQASPYSLALRTGTTTAIKIEGTTSPALGFYGVTPVTRPSAYTQTYSTAAKTNPNMTASTVSTTASTNVAPYGYTTSAQADAIVTTLNALITDVTDLKKLVNSIIDDGQALGLLQ
jgi:hypothetical protein